jgi:FixJ family two-component response regulator
VQDRHLIVVVDDDHNVLKSIGRLLEANGFETKLFSSAEAYKAYYRTSDAACLILDIHMRGMSGIDLQRELIRSGELVPVIFITGDDSVATERSVAEAGCACIRKPCTATALLEAVKKAVSGEP